MTASDVVRTVLELIATRRYGEVAAYVDAEALREMLAREVASVRSRPSHVLTPDDMRGSDPDMPDVVAEYWLKQTERAKQTFDPIRHRFARVGSVEELEAQSDGEALARLLEARDHDYQFRVAAEAHADRLPPDWEKSVPGPPEAPVPRVLGEVPVGDHALVTYAQLAGADRITADAVQHALLRSSNGEWRLLPEGTLFGHAGMTGFAFGLAAAGEAPLKHEPSGPPPLQQSWTERSFATGLAPDRFPAILDRFRGVGPRIQQLIATTSAEALRWHPGPTSPNDRPPWSIQEHIGHLLDLEELGERRLRDYLSGTDDLSPADMTNRKTNDAGHDERNAWELGWEFEHARQRLVDVLERLGEDDLRRTALHPRLKQPMTMVDWVHFMCEHDDHHFARIAELRRDLTASAGSNRTRA